MNEPKEQGEENMWSFYFCYHFGLNWRSSNVLSYVYWTSFCYTLIDLLACVPYYSMHVLNKHEGLSKKKEKMRDKRKTGEALQQVKIAEDTPKKREDDQGHEKESSEPPSIEVTEQRETDADKENHKKITQTRFQQPLRRRAKISR